MVRRLQIAGIEADFHADGLEKLLADLGFIPSLSPKREGKSARIASALFIGKFKINVATTAK